MTTSPGTPGRPLPILVAVVALASTGAGVLDLDATREDVEPLVLDAAQLEPSDHLTASYVTLLGRVDPAAMRPHQHVEVRRHDTRRESRWFVPVVAATLPLPPRVFLELPDLRFSDGRLALPYDPSLTELRGWLRPAPSCSKRTPGRFRRGADAPREALLLDATEPAPDEHVSWTMIALGVAMGLALLAWLTVTGRPRERAGAGETMGAWLDDVATYRQGELALGLFGAGAALVSMIDAVRLLRLVDAGIGVVPVGLMTLVGAGFLAAALMVDATEYRASREGLRLVDGATGALQQVRWRHVDRVRHHWTTRQVGRHTETVLHLELGTVDRRSLTLLLPGDGPNAFGTRVANAAADAMWSPTLAEWQAGEPLRFGAAELQGSTLRVAGGTVVELGDVEAATLRRGALELTTAHGVAVVPTAGMADSVLFCRICAHALARARPAVTPGWDERAVPLT